MSAYGEFETQMTDKECLVEALHTVGYQPNVYETPQQLIGYRGDKRVQTADIVIPRSQVGGASNDVGYKLTDKGTYTAIVSDFDRGYNFGPAKQKQVEANYAVQKNLRVLKKQGAKVKSTERRLVNGRMATVITAKAK
jgi:hypothetical protein